MWTRSLPWSLVQILVAGRAALIAENLALRQQLTVLHRNAGRPRLHRRDRIFWVWLSRLWTGWRAALVIVQPDTVVRTTLVNGGTKFSVGTRAEEGGIPRHPPPRSGSPLPRKRTLSSR